jgi:hypothetical protein
MNTKGVCWLTAGCLAVTALVAATLIPGVSEPLHLLAGAGSNGFSPYVTKDGGISLPTDYRDKFIHLGTWAVASKANQPVREMHNVYARAEDVRAYRRDGKFPDGAVLIKEIADVGSAKLTTGQPTWSTGVKSWFVMVKDTKGRFPKNDLWGDGWGWALFEAKDPTRNVATDFKTDCLPCHIPAKKHDWLYVRGYSILVKPITPK